MSKSERRVVVRDLNTGCMFEILGVELVCDTLTRPERYSIDGVCAGLCRGYVLKAHIEVTGFAGGISESMDCI